MSNASEHLQIRKDSQQKSKFINQGCLPGLSVVEINPTELCNRTCSFCPRSDHEVYPNQNLNMSVDTAELLLSQLLENEYSGLICFSGFGEPTLNPNILHLIKLFSAHFSVELISNGDRFTNGYFSIDQLIECNLNSLILDAYDGDQQYEKFQTLFADYPGQFRIRKNYDTKSADLIQEYNFNNRGGMLNCNDNMNATNPCYLPMYKTFIDWNGDVILCCNNWARQSPQLRNIHNENIKNIWNSDTFITVRKNLLQGCRNRVPACHNCNIEGTKVGLQSAEIWNKIVQQNRIV